MRIKTLLSLTVAAALFPAVLPAGDQTQAAGPTTSAIGVITVPYAEELQVFHANGQDVTINSDGNRVIITGRCGTLTVNGVANYVTVQSASKIVVNGNYSKVRWNNPNNETPPTTEKNGYMTDITHPGGAAFQ